jgi:deazaflavin-dependent oxidoreductase (nitroreductase family)
VTVGGHPYVVGTNFGRADHPGWTSNLLAQPIAVIDYQTERWAARAVPIAAPEQEPLWPLFYDMLPAYRAYRARLDRSVRMFRLERV